MKKVLVTGATGFIGNYVVEELLKRGYAVTASSVNPEKAKQFPWFGAVNYIAFDLASFDDSVNYYQFFQQPDLLIHLAWEGLPNYKEDFHLTQNLPRHFAFLKNMLQNGLKDLTVTGTCFEYGMKEGCLSEDMPAAPVNPYARSKDELRKQLEVLQQELSFNLKWIRLFYMYGNGQGPKSLISQLEKVIEAGEAEFNMSGGQQVRDFLPVEKVAAYIVTIAAQQKEQGVINCCSGVGVTVQRFVENYLQQRDKKIRLNLGYYPYTDWEPMSFWGDAAKLDRVK